MSCFFCISTRSYKVRRLFKKITPFQFPLLLTQTLASPPPTTTTTSLTTARPPSSWAGSVTDEDAELPGPDQQVESHHDRMRSQLAGASGRPGLAG